MGTNAVEQVGKFYVGMTAEDAKAQGLGGKGFLDKFFHNESLFFSEIDIDGDGILSEHEISVEKMFQDETKRLAKNSIISSVTGILGGIVGGKVLLTPGIPKPVKIATLVALGVLGIGGEIIKRKTNAMPNRKEFQQNLQEHLVNAEKPNDVE